jgi:hypothetical protein
VKVSYAKVSYAKEAYALYDTRIREGEACKCLREPGTWMKSSHER